MLDKVEYWLNLCDEDVLNAKAMINGKRFLGAGYFCHQIAEKALKAVVSHNTGESPPRTHKLLKLADQAGLLDELSEEHLFLLKGLVPLQVEARYPEYKEQIAKTLNDEKCRELLKESEEFLCWIKKKLEK